MDSTSSNETIYEIYKNAHFTWNIAFWAFLLNVVAFFGICLNSSVIWVTFKTKTLHGTANFNLALGCLFEVFHQFGHLLFLFTAFSGQNFLPYTHAVQICTIPLFGLGSVALSIALTALDRLLYVIFPLRTFMTKPTSYLTIITIICLCFSLQNVFIFYKTAEAFPNLMITGSMDEILSSEPGKEIYNYISLSLNALTLIIYIALGILLKIKRANISAMNDSGRIYRSILVLITVRLSGFFAMRIFRLYIAHGIWPFMTRWCISQTMSILLNMSTASTGPILYGTSSDYRAAFLKEFNLVLRLLKCHRGSRVHTITTFPQSIVCTENVAASVQGISILHKSPRSPSWQITERRRLASAYR